MFVQQMAPEQRIQEAATRALVVQQDARLNVEQRVQRLESVDPGSADAVLKIVEELSKPVVRPEELQRLKEEAAELPAGPQVEEMRQSLDAAFQIADMKILVDGLSNVGEELVERRNQLLERETQLTHQRAGVTAGLAVSLFTHGMTLIGFLSKRSHSKLEMQLLDLQIKEKRADLKAKGVDLSG